MKGNELKYEIGALSEAEKKKIGVFISYSHAQSEVSNELIKYLVGSGLNVLSDKLLSPDTNNFYVTLNDYIDHATCGVFVGGDLTPWTAYEIGRLHTLGKKIYVYRGGNKVHSIFRNSIVFDDAERLLATCRNDTLFDNLFEEETEDFSISDFNAKVVKKLQYASLKLTVPGLKQFDSCDYDFGVIVPRLFRAGKINEKAICPKYKTEYNANSQCLLFANKEGDSRCPFQPPLGAHPKENVLLNKILYTHNVVGDEVNYLIPCSSLYGVTFKCFVDIKRPSISRRLLETLSAAGITGWCNTIDFVKRLYFLVPKKREEGLFIVKEIEGIENNYLCPDLTQKKD